LFGWFMAWVAVGVGILGYFWTAKGLSPPNFHLERVRFGGIGAWWAYIIYVVILAPFYEEVVMRGFVYRALRADYGIILSTLVVLIANAYFHWRVVSGPSGSLTGLVFPTVGAGFLCLIRERTNSVWNCVLFHAAHNATATLPWPAYVVGILLILPFCTRGAQNRPELGVVKGASPGAPDSVSESTVPSRKPNTNTGANDPLGD